MTPAFQAVSLRLAQCLRVLSAVHKHQQGQKDKGSQRAGKGTQGTTCGTVGRRGFPVCEPVHEGEGGSYTDDRVYHLFNDLGNRGRHHVAKSLEIAAHHAHNGKDQNGGCHNL